MKKFLSLTWLQIKVHLGLADLFTSLRGSSKEKMRGIGYIVLFLFIVGTLVGVVSFLMNALFGVVMIPVLQQTVLAMIILAGMLVSLLFGVFYAISLYYSKDNEFLMSLPLPKTAAFASKFIVAMLGEIGTFALLVIPALVTFSLHVTVDFSFCLIGLLVVLFGPFIPFAIANLLAALVMRVSALSRHRNQIAIVGGFILLAGYLFLNQYLSANLPQMSSQDIMILLSGGIVKAVTAAFPPAQWAAAALVSQGPEALTGLLLFVGVSALAFLLCILVSGRLFASSASSQSETFKKNKRIAIGELGRKVRSPEMSIFVKEWKVILRSPVYAMNSLTAVIMAPLMVAVMVFTPAKGLEGGLIGALGMLNGANVTGYFLLGGAAYCYLMASINVACMTMYSREGDAIWIVQVMPVNAKSIYLGKLLCSISISALAVFATSIAFTILLQIDVFTSFGSALLGLIACTPMLIISLLFDMLWPKLHWDSERKAIKSNVNSLIGMMVAFLFEAVLVFGVITLLNSGTSILAAVMIVLALCVTLSVLSYGLSVKQAQKLQDRMGER